MYDTATYANRLAVVLGDLARHAGLTPLPDRAGCELAAGVALALMPLLRLTEDQTISLTAHLANALQRYAQADGLNRRN